MPAEMVREKVTKVIKEVAKKHNGRKNCADTRRDIRADVMAAMRDPQMDTVAEVWWDDTEQDDMVPHLNISVFGFYPDGGGTNSPVNFRIPATSLRYQEGQQDFEFVLTLRI